MGGFLSTLTVCLWWGCHDARRGNPLDPELTPGVELLSVAADSLRGTATLMWSPYTGDQPFQAYQVVRRISGQIEAEVRATISDIGTTRFVDTSVEGDRVYVYNVVVMNAAGYTVSSSVKELSYASVPPTLWLEEMSSGTAAASLRWSRATSGFESYTLVRRAEGQILPAIVHATPNLVDTAFVDEGLDGGKTYSYTLTLRTNTGTDLISDPVSGRFHELVDEWGWPEPPDAFYKAMAVDPAGDLFLSSGAAVNVFNPTQPEGKDRLHWFDASGAEKAAFPSDPFDEPGVFEARRLAADEASLFVLMTQPLALAFSTTSEGPADALQNPTIGAFVHAFTKDGSHRFRWPATGTEPNLTDLSVVPGQPWVWTSQAGTDAADPVTTLHKIDKASGRLEDTIVIEGVFISLLGLDLAAGEPYVVLRAVNDREQQQLWLDPDSGSIVRRVSGAELAEGMVESCWGIDDRLFVLHSNPFRVQVLRDGRLLTRWALHDHTPEWIATDGEGRIYTVSTGGATLRVQVFEP